MCADIYLNDDVQQGQPSGFPSGVTMHHRIAAAESDQALSDEDGQQCPRLV
jgi:hypothetical protein